jgi:hypothetical protein
MEVPGVAVSGSTATSRHSREGSGSTTALYHGDLEARHGNPLAKREPLAAQAGPSGSSRTELSALLPQPEPEAQAQPGA